MKKISKILSIMFNSGLIAMVFCLLLLSCTEKKPKNHKYLTANRFNSDSMECEMHRLYILRTKSDSLPQKIKYIPRNIDECIAQIDSLLSKKVKEYFACLSREQYSAKVHHSFGMYLRNQWGLWWNSRLAKYFNSYKIYHPDSMSGIILICYHNKLCGIPYKFEEEVNHVLLCYKKQAEYEAEIARINKIKYDKTKKWVDSLNTLVGYAKKLKKLKGFVNDSINFYQIKQVGDTTEYWTIGSEGWETKDIYLNTVHRKDYGVTKFIDYISEAGEIYTKTLHVQKFYKKNGCLYYTEYKSNFIKVFDPVMLTEKKNKMTWKRNDSDSFNSSTIKNIWIVDNKKYYQLYLYGPYGDSYIARNYYIDQDLNVIFDQRLLNKIFSQVSLIKNGDI
jgi:hypothetical protein